MLKIILDRHVFYVLMGVSAIVGVTAKVVVGATLRRLIVAAGSMGKSNHPLMRLVRAKFEHTCMISEKVENVSVFVDKYLYEYRVAGIRFHAWRRLEMAGAALCLVLGGTGAAVSYRVKGMTDQAAVLGGTGAALALVVFLIHMLTDEEYRVDAVRNYMVDYLENIYQHRYEKNSRKEELAEAAEREALRTEAVKRDGQDESAAGQTFEERSNKGYARKSTVESGVIQSEVMNQGTKEPEPEPVEPDSLIWAMYKTEPLQVEDERKVTTAAPVKTTDKSMEKRKEKSEKHPEKAEKLEVSQKPEKAEKPQESGNQKASDEAVRNQRIREILEEFMA